MKIEFTRQPLIPPSHEDLYDSGCRECRGPRRALWLLPVTFPMVMTLRGMLGLPSAREDSDVSGMAISWIVFACVFGGALLGVCLRAMLPEHHLSTESKDVVKLGTGLLATMAALVLGLLIASAKRVYS
jgi:hypothetical protein